ncbi:YwiB family protein [Lactococcus kimchii]|uniref:DUF1934 domain-containing protein n=1 Tax=Lactococcus sp. S-13 TaxID=2507158 RepID=UPI001CC21BCE|nr:DUF1934 domain-containing protein [Lactococcus sp. S-13]
MKITIRNRIKIDHQEELIKESYPVELKKGNSATMLRYQNATGEKILLKFDEQALTMTRFSTPPVKMHFHPENPSVTNYEGLGELSLSTQTLSIDPEQQKIKISYQLAQQGLKIGDYHLRIDWTDEEGDK